MRSTPRAWFSTALLSVALACATDAGAFVTYSLAPGSPTVPAAGPPNCGPPFSAFGDLVAEAGFFVPTSIVRMGPPGCGLGWPGPAAPANLDGFSAGVATIPVPVPAGLLSFHISVDGGATGGLPGCVPAAPGPSAPDVGSEACAQPAASDAAADLYVTTAPGPPVLPTFAPGSMPLFQHVDGNGVLAPGCVGPATLPSRGLVEPMPGGDVVDDIDATPLGIFLASGIPTIPVYFSVDSATAAAAAFLPSDVIVTVGGFIAGVYAAPGALGLDLIGGPGSDDTDGLAVDDVAGSGLVFTPGAGDVVIFSLTPGSATIGTPNPPGCPLAGLPRAAGDILTEGSLLGAPGAACTLVPAENMNLWTLRTCGLNPLTGAGDDNLNGIDVGPPATSPTPTPTNVTPTPTPTGLTATPTQAGLTPTSTGPTATPTSPTQTPTFVGLTQTPTPGGLTPTPTPGGLTPTSTPGGLTPTPTPGALTPTPTPAGPTVTTTLTATPVAPTLTPTITSTPVAPTPTLTPTPADTGTPILTATPSQTPTPVCGNLQLDGGETCDPPGVPQPPNGNACRADCTYCGDMVIQTGAGEICDDANTVSGCRPDRPQDALDSCLNNCQFPICEDPSRIQLFADRNDVVQVHGRLIAPTEIDFRMGDFRIKIARRVCTHDTSLPCRSDEECEALSVGSLCTQDAPASLVFEQTIAAQALVGTAPRWKYRDPAAKVNGGLYGIKIIGKTKRKVCAGGTNGGARCTSASECPAGSCLGYYAIKLTAYGVVVGAVADMQTELHGGGYGWAIRGIWQERPKGWRLYKKSLLLDPWL